MTSIEQIFIHEPTFKFGEWTGKMKKIIKVEAVNI